MTRLLTAFSYYPAWTVVLLSILIVSSCNVVDEDREDCGYNVHITYRYNREYSTTENLVRSYVSGIKEYIFAENDTLVAIHTLLPCSSGGGFVSELNLPVGRYTVISWGNPSSLSRLNRAKIGSTTRSQMSLYLDNIYMGTPDSLFQQNSERLFYGYRTFSVEAYGISKVFVDLVHSHCELTITVTWKNSADVPANTGDFFLLLRGVSPRMDFLPEYVFKNRLPSAYTLCSDEYPRDGSDIRHYIPVVHSDEGLLTHRVAARMSDGKSLTGKFVTYRYRNRSHPLLSVYTQEKQLMKEIDLETFFHSIELDTNLRQEFEIGIEIEGNTVRVGLINVGDWEDNGFLGV